MALDGRLLGRARQKLEEDKNRRALELERRTEEVYRKAPRVRELDGEIRSTAARAVVAAISGEEDSVQTVETLGRENLRLQEDRVFELTLAGFPADYLDDGYDCPDCRDTGYVGAEMCRCLRSRYVREQELEFARLFPGDVSFDTFDLMVFDDTPDETGLSPRRRMEIIYESCVQFALKFDLYRRDLFLQGPTGTGKTYLAACIYRAVAVTEKSHWVIYDSAQAVLARLEREKFSRESEDEDAHDSARRLYDCDLLIIDDFGTEMPGGFTNSALYELINRRLRTDRRTVICTNLTDAQLEQRYTPQILSRLCGEDQRLLLRGRDPRRKK